MGADVKLRFDGPGDPLHAEPFFRGGGGAHGGGHGGGAFGGEPVSARCGGGRDGGRSAQGSEGYEGCVGVCGKVVPAVIF